jgi:serine/threonine-protein kinase
MLVPGTRVGNYEILEPIGAGGTGEVYRARDARLGRDVAIKVLAEGSRLDTQGLRRFEREARVLASLNHPNIATLHAIEPFGHTQALVLELVEGDTLSERIALGALPLMAALAVARQIAAALGAAHEQGVVHRDLKPSNVKLRPDGTLKLLDFGLAKVGEGLPAGEAGGATLTMVGEPGLVMGTPAYMSPEQARGLPVDKRADIWAFGCVLFEMLAGVPPFAGERTSDVLAKIIEREPDFGLLPAATPRAVRNLLQRCLRKDPRERLRDIGDARLYLEESGAADIAGFRSRAGSARHWPRWAALAALALAGMIAAAAFLPLRGRPVAPVPAGPVVRYSIAAPIASSFYARALAISPDGVRIAYVSERGLVVRSRDRLEERELPIAGGDGMGAPFFSPDGRWIGYTDGQSLLKVPTDGGEPVEIADAGVTAIGSWSDAGIIFASMAGLFQVPSQGGSAVQLEVQLGPAEQAVFPQVLPVGGVVLFTVLPRRSNTLTSSSVGSVEARVDVFDPRSGAHRTLLRGGGRAQYIPTGHLLYVSGSTLYAVAFDLQRLALRGDPVAVVAGLRNTDYGIAQDGTLVYQTGASEPERTLVWVDRQGKEEPLDAPPRRYAYPRISPDGTRVALDMMGPQDRDIFIWDLRSRKLQRFSIDPTGNPLVAWSRDGRTLAYGTSRYGVITPMLQAAEGQAEPQRLMNNERLRMPLAFAPDGRLLLSGDVPGRGRDVLALSMDGSGREEPILHSAANDATAEVSPDGRWIVYDSDESGQYEVYVRPYPDAYSGQSWRISSAGGRNPLWSHDGRELYFRDFDGAMWAVPTRLQPGFAAGEPVRLFANANYAHGGRRMSGRNYDVARDGRRFLMVKEAGRAAPAEGSAGLVVVLNWFEELRRLMADASGPAGT